MNNNIDANVFFYGAFEKPLLFFLRDTLNALITETPKAIFMDIGANVGHHSIFLSKFASQVLAFEPYPKVNMQFKQQIAHNNISNIQIFETGLSDRRETLNYYAPTGNNEGIGSFDESSISKGNTSYGKLELQEGDQVIESDSWKDIKLIKIDVEGFEKKVIKGLSRTIEEERPVIVCEITYGQPLSFVSIEELESYLPKNIKNKVLLEGVAVGSKISTGKIKKMFSLDSRDSYSKVNKFNKGDILVTEMTDPDWEPIMKLSSGIITNKGGRTCHASIVARELGMNNTIFKNHFCCFGSTHSQLIFFFPRIKTRSSSFNNKCCHSAIISFVSISCNNNCNIG